MHNRADSSSPSATLHYFQTPREDWELLLVRMRQMGASAIHTAVPWSWHAPSPDACDFMGATHPQRDLLGFVTLCDRLGLGVMLQPGPFHSNELLGDDIPAWLLAQHPGIHALRPDDQTWRHAISGLSRVCALHPTFVQHARAWHTAFSAAFAAHQHPNGPIVAVQLGDMAPFADDDIDPRFRADYNPWIIANPWPAWLHDNYRRDASRLYAPADCLPPSAWEPPRSLNELRRYVYWSRFVEFYSHTELVSRTEWLREQGWQVPLFAHAQAISGSSVAAPQHAFELSARDAWPNHAQKALVRPDGSVRPWFWQARGPLSLLDAADGDFARSHIPADIVLGYSRLPKQVSQWISGDIAEHRVLATRADHIEQAQMLAQRLMRAGVSFDVINLDAASLEDLERYRLVIAPASPVLARATQHKLIMVSHLALIGETLPVYDEQLLPCDLLSSKAIMHLPESVDGAALGALVEEHGGFARYAWADGENVDVLVRHGATGATYLNIVNRRTQPYSGMLAYRTPSGEIEHIHISLGPQREGLLLLRDNEVLGVALDGDASEGSWLVRGLRSSLAWSGGAAMVAPYRQGHEVGALLVSASHSGRLDLRRSEAWDEVTVYRLLFDGRALTAAFRTEGSHFILPYLGEDAEGQTDAYLVLLTGEVLPQAIIAYLNTQLHAQASVLERSADLLASAQQASELPAALRSASTTLGELVGQCYTIQQYSETLESVAATIQHIAMQLTLQFGIERGGMTWVVSSPGSAATIVERVITNLTRGV